MAQHKRHAVWIYVREIIFSTSEHSSATEIVGYSNEIRWNSEMTLRQIKAMSKSEAYGNDSIEVEVEIHGDPIGLKRTISPYHSCFTCVTTDKNGVKSYGTERFKSLERKDW
jgi:hypothetical protein